MNLRPAATGAAAATTASAPSPRPHQSPSSQKRTVVEPKSCGSGATRGIVVIDDNVGTRPESVVNRRGSRGPPLLRGGDTKAPLPPTWGSARGLCWFRKKSSISATLCYLLHSNLRTRGARIGRRYIFSISLERICGQQSDLTVEESDARVDLRARPLCLSQQLTKGAPRGAGKARHCQEARRRPWSPSIVPPPPSSPY